MVTQLGSSKNQVSSAKAVKRQSFIDVLRGFSLLGILLVNIEYIVQTLDIGWAEYRSSTDLFVRWLLLALGQAKVYPLFAMLFGFGLSLQMRKGSADLTTRYRRRMVGLLFLGVLHGIFFFPGDILVLYAIVGFFAYRFRNTPSRKLIKLAIRIYGIASASWIAIGVLDVFQTHNPSTVSDDVITILSQGSFFEVTSQNVGYWLVTFAILFVIQGPAVIASFLAGMALGRTDVLKEPEKHRPFARKVLLFIAPLALVAAGIGAAMEIYMSSRWGTLGFAIGFAAAPLVTATYIAVLSLSFGSQSNNMLAVLFRKSGRMSLTIYVAESVVVAFLSYGYGVGMFGKVSPLEGVGLSIAVWFGLAVFSVLWIKKFRFGPLEWLLRSFTYRKWQPLR